MYGNLFRRILGLNVPAIETAIKLFGKENVIIRLYDRSLLKEGSSVVDLFDAMGIALQGELLEAARERRDNSKIPDETLPFLSKLVQIMDLGDPDPAKDMPFARAIASKIEAAFDPAQQGSGTGLGMEAELQAVIDKFEALAPGYKNLFKDRPCSFSFPEIDLDPKELLKFDLLCSLYKNDFRRQQTFAGLKEEIVADIERALFPNLMQRLALFLASPVLKLSWPRERYAVFRKLPNYFLAAPDRYPVKRLRQILRFFGPIPPALDRRGQVNHLEENIDYLLAGHGRLAFWGLGNYFRLNVPSSLSDRPGIFLVDRGSRDSFGRKQDQSPDALKSERVGLIVISAGPDSAPYRGISRDIDAEYPDAAVLSLEYLLRRRLPAK
jgi:hypothetical protein